MNSVTPLRTSEIGGVTISTIRKNFTSGASWNETMLFLNGREVEGLVEFETMSGYETWEENHAALYIKAGNILAFGPA